MTNLRIYELALNQTREEWFFNKRLGIDDDITEKLWKEVVILQEMVWREQEVQAKPM